MEYHCFSVLLTGHWRKPFIFLCKLSLTHNLLDSAFVSEAKYYTTICDSHGYPPSWIKLFKENIGINLYDFGLGNGFLDLKIKALTIKEKIHKLDLIKI